MYFSATITDPHFSVSGLMKTRGKITNYKKLAGMKEDSDTDKHTLNNNPNTEDIIDISSEDNYDIDKVIKQEEISDTEEV